MNKYNGSLVINTREYGFFSSLFQIIDNLRYCEINNLKPIMNIGDKFLYQNGNKNPWGEFFEDINDSVSEGDISEISQLTSNANFLIEDYMMVSPSRHDYHLKLWNILQSGNGQAFYDYRVQINAMISKYIVPIKEIKQEVEKNINDMNIGLNTLALHMRTTDYGHHDIDRYKSVVQDVLNSKKYDNIFVASDSIESIMIIKNNFPNVRYYETPLRSEKLTTMVPLCHIVNGNDKIKHGKDVLIETLLLSSCGRLVCINSNVSAMACFYSPSMDVVMVGRQHGGG